MNRSPDALLDAFKEMTLLELSEFIKEFETAFGVKAAAPTVATGPPPPPAEEAPEQEEFTVILAEVGGSKIQVIKEVRTLTSLGLKDAKDAVDAVPTELLKNVDKPTADKAKAALEAAGAKVQVQ